MTAPVASQLWSSIICEVLLPGAAHMSSTISLGFTSKSIGGIMLTSSFQLIYQFICTCLVIRPASAALYMNLCNELNIYDFLNFC